MSSSKNLFLVLSLRTPCAGSVMESQTVPTAIAAPIIEPGTPITALPKYKIYEASVFAIKL